MIENISILKNITILYAEDEENLRDITLNILKGFTKKQYVACDGQEGLELFKKHEEEIDLIITDINMPRMNGLEMIKNIKEINSNIPIIVATAFSNTEYLLEAIDIGVDKYILKPIDMKKLLQIMSQSLLYHELKDLYIDKITKLPNRNKLKKDLNANQEDLMALINIDKFSTINDLYGEANGDKILYKFSQELLKDFSKDIFTTYRIEADKFAVVTLGSYLSVEEFKGMCEKFADKIEKNSIKLDEHSIDLHITIGIAKADASDVYRYTQRVINYARRKFEKILIYKDSYNFQEDFQDNMKWVKKVKNGIQNNRFTAYYQPIVDTKTQKIYKYEALIRYVEDNGDVISPYKFLDIAKKVKLYPKIIEIMLVKSIKLIREKNKRVSVNISFADISSSNTRNHILDTLEQNKQYVNLLEFEILESEEISDFNAVRKFIADVKSYGCAVGVDDFGAGYSNFNMLTDLDIDFVKIDGSLVKELDKNNNHEIIVETISSFTKKLGFKTVAEFVCNEEVYKKVKKLDIDYSQGYYFSEPISFEMV
ncbi:MAG: EAL domain-containing protein [Campylobacterales bacterium]|nr:EAL domain-containing protein [Campylobacterales bacterium]